MKAPITELFVRTSYNKAWTMHRFAEPGVTLCGKQVRMDETTDPKKHPSPREGWRMFDCTACYCESTKPRHWCQVLGPDGYDRMHVSKSAQEAALDAATDAGIGEYRVRYLMEGIIRQHLIVIACSGVTVQVGG